MKPAPSDPPSASLLEPASADDHVCWGGGQRHPASHELWVKDLSVSYRETRALEHVNLHSRCGRSVALVGPNGAGKSTLIKTMAGIVKPDDGEILWRGRRLDGTSREIAYLPQRSEVDWLFPVTVRGLVEMGRYPVVGWWGAYRRHDKDIVDRALETMQLTDLQNRQIGALSGGQQQRTFIARALAQEAHVLILDEPFTGLDKPAQEQLCQLFGELTAEGRLLVASHHELGSVAPIFDEVLLLRRHVVAFGPVEDVFTPSNIEETFGTV